MASGSSAKKVALVETPFGERSHEDMLAKIILNGLPDGMTRGLFTQLNDVNPAYAFVAAKHICLRKAGYETKLVQLAEETYTGLPVGRKMVHGEITIMEVLRRVPSGSLVKFTFRKDRHGHMHELDRLYAIKELITFEPSWLRLVSGCVAVTGEWQGIERSSIARVSITDESQLVACARILIPTLESLELVRAA